MFTVRKQKASQRINTLWDFLFCGKWEDKYFVILFVKFSLLDNLGQYQYSYRARRPSHSTHIPRPKGDFLLITTQHLIQSSLASCSPSRSAKFSVTLSESNISFLNAHRLSSLVWLSAVGCHRVMFWVPWQIWLHFYIPHKHNNQICRWHNSGGTDLEIAMKHKTERK